MQKTGRNFYVLGKLCVNQLLLMHLGQINPTWLRVLHPTHFMLLMSSFMHEQP